MVKLAVVALLAQVAGGEPPRSGPFGIAMGMSTEDIKKAVGGDLKPGNTKGLYILPKAPRPHPQFTLYAIMASSATGVCRVRGITNAFESDAYGSGLRSKFEAIAEQIAGVYGQGERLDRLRPGSIWHEPNEFMMGLFKKERFLSHVWVAGKENVTMKDSIGALALEASASDRDTATILITYDFENYDACKKALAEEEAKAF